MMEPSVRDGVWASSRPLNNAMIFIPHFKTCCRANPSITPGIGGASRGNGKKSGKMPVPVGFLYALNSAFAYLHQGARMQLPHIAFRAVHTARPWSTIRWQKLLDSSGGRTALS